MGRPRKPTRELSKWGLWKRGQREKPASSCKRCGSSTGLNRHHKSNSYRGSQATEILCDKCHAAHHNALRSRL